MRQNFPWLVETYPLMLKSVKMYPGGQLQPTAVVEAVEDTIAAVLDEQLAGTNAAVAFTVEEPPQEMHPLCVCVATNCEGQVVH